MHEVKPLRRGESGDCGGVAVVPGERAPGVARDERCCSETGGSVEPQLLERQTRQRLRAAEEDDTLVEQVPVVQLIRR